MNFNEFYKLLYVGFKKVTKEHTTDLKFNVVTGLHDIIPVCKIYNKKKGFIKCSGKESRNVKMILIYPFMFAYKTIEF